MIDDNKLHLFCLNSAVLQSRVDTAMRRVRTNESVAVPIDEDDIIGSYVPQFQMKNRNDAHDMSRYYRIFYMLENDIRSFIFDMMFEKYGADWWRSQVPLDIQEAVTKNMERETEQGITPRSSNDLDYTTFGHLSEIIKYNWDVFAGSMTDKKAVQRVMTQLNMLRGPIAHCNVLAEDEVDRLKSTVKDWFRVQGASKL